MRIVADGNGIYQKREHPVLGFFTHSGLGVDHKKDGHIVLNESLLKTEDEITQTLIHELLHFSLWWQGYDSNDGSPDFENRLKELGLPSDYDITWDDDGNCMRKLANREKMASYIGAYHEYVRKRQTV